MPASVVQRTTPVNGTGTAVTGPVFATAPSADNVVVHLLVCRGGATQGFTLDQTGQELLDSPGSATNTLWLGASVHQGDGSRTSWTFTMGATANGWTVHAYEISGLDDTSLAAILAATVGVDTSDTTRTSTSPTSGTTSQEDVFVLELNAIREQSVTGSWATGVNDENDTNTGGPTTRISSCTAEWSRNSGTAAVNDTCSWSPAYFGKGAILVFKVAAVAPEVDVQLTAEAATGQTVTASPIAVDVQLSAPAATGQADTTMAGEVDAALQTEPAGGQADLREPAAAPPETPTYKRVLWRADFDVAGYGDRELSNVEPNGSYTVTIPATQAGESVAQLQIDTTAAGTHGVRLEVHDRMAGGGQMSNHPDVTYYKTRYYIDETSLSHAGATSFINLFQTKQAWNPGTETRQLNWWVGLSRDSNRYLQLKSYLGDDGNPVPGNEDVANSTTAVPLQTWFEMTARCVWSADPLVGRITFWLDGVLIFDEFHRTLWTGAEYELPAVTRDARQWTVNMYAEGTTPAVVDAYVDWMEVYVDEAEYGAPVFPSLLGTRSYITSTGSASASGSHTLAAGSNRRVLIGITYDETGTTEPTVSSLTYGGVAATLVTDGTTQAKARAATTNQTVSQVWEVLEASLPADGANTVSLTLSTAVDAIQMTVVAVQDTDQSADIHKVATQVQTSSNTDSTVTITPTVDGCLLLDVLAGSTAWSLMDAWGRWPAVTLESIAGNVGHAVSQTWQPVAGAAALLWNYDGASQARTGHVALALAPTSGGTVTAALTAEAATGQTVASNPVGVDAALQTEPAGGQAVTADVPLLSLVQLTAEAATGQADIIFVTDTDVQLTAEAATGQTVVDVQVEVQASLQVEPAGGQTVTSSHVGVDSAVTAEAATGQAVTASPIDAAAALQVEPATGQVVTTAPTVVDVQLQSPPATGQTVAGVQVAVDSAVTALPATGQTVTASPVGVEAALQVEPAGGQAVTEHQVAVDAALTVEPAGGQAVTSLASSATVQLTADAATGQTVTSSPIDAAAALTAEAAAGGQTQVGVQVAAVVQLTAAAATGQADTTMAGEVDAALTTEPATGQSVTSLASSAVVQLTVEPAGGQTVTASPIDAAATLQVEPAGGQADLVIPEQTVDSTLTVEPATGQAVTEVALAGRSVDGQLTSEAATGQTQTTVVVAAEATLAAPAATGATTTTMAVEAQAALQVEPATGVTVASNPTPGVHASLQTTAATGQAQATVETDTSSHVSPEAATGQTIGSVDHDLVVQITTEPASGQAQAEVTVVLEVALTATAATGRARARTDLVEWWERNPALHTRTPTGVTRAPVAFSRVPPGVTPPTDWSE